MKGGLAVEKKALGIGNARRRGMSLAAASCRPDEYLAFGYVTFQAHDYSTSIAMASQEPPSLVQPTILRLWIFAAIGAGT